MRRIITISYTGLDAGGGVPKFNRDLHAAFPDRECHHFCWMDFPWHPEVDERGETEWGRARLLNEYLTRSRLVRSDDVVIADGFWAAGLEHMPLAISHSHGIWSHLTADDVAAGKQPDMPYHHVAQVEFRRRWLGLGKCMTAVSHFISEQMRMQWGFEVEAVIPNGVDIGVYHPRYGEKSVYVQDKPLIVHGVNDRANKNKGWDHIELLKEGLGDQTYIYSLDELYAQSRIWSDRNDWDKPSLLAQADVVVHPSGYEGCSMFVAEAMASGVPIVAYDVGALYDLENDGFGMIMPLSSRSPEFTLNTVNTVLNLWTAEARAEAGCYAREMAERRHSLENFRARWREYIEFKEHING